jgi:hypothetical protein
MVASITRVEFALNLLWKQIINLQAHLRHIDETARRQNPSLLPQVVLCAVVLCLYHFYGTHWGGCTRVVGPDLIKPWTSAEVALNDGKTRC